MDNVIPIDPEASVLRRSKPASRLARIIALTHPQLAMLSREYAEGAYPPEFAAEAKEIANRLVAHSAKVRAFEASEAKPMGHHINRVMGRLADQFEGEGR